MTITTKTIYEKIELTEAEQTVIKEILKIAQSYDFSLFDLNDCLHDLADLGEWAAENHEFI